MTRHFLTLFDLSKEELHALLHRAIALKAMRKRGELFQPLVGKTLAMVFEKASTRTRVSFEAAMAQCGGTALFLSPRDAQIGRGEPIEDTARVLSRMVDAVMIRTFAHEGIECFAQSSMVPVINGLTDLHHPCQLLADLQTFLEHRGDPKGAKVAWIGDGNNMCHSYIQAAVQMDFQLQIACPQGYEPDASIMATGKGHVNITNQPQEAAEKADLIVTDVWASMGQEDEQQARAALFAPFCVNSKLMSLAKQDALFMHCLPAHRGEEVTGDVIDGSQSIVWDEAENRLHAQKALLELLLLHPSA